MLSPNRDGILQIDSEERLKSFDVKVTTEAIDEESKKQAETTITVYVKRVTKVTLNKKSEELLNPNDNIPGKLEVMQGSTVVLVGTVDGVKLGNKCDSCGEDPTGDRYLTGWTVVFRTPTMKRPPSRSRQMQRWGLRLPFGQSLTCPADVHTGRYRARLP